MIKNLTDTTDADNKRIISQQLEKCDEKMEALMMMMVHYCSGLQHCLGLYRSVLQHCLGLYRSGL